MTTPQVDPNVQAVIDEVNKAADDPYIQATVSRVTPNIPSKVRNILYTIGVWAGVAGAVAAPIDAVLTGNAAVAVASVGAIALALQSLLAKLNISKTAEDLAKS